MTTIHKRGKRFLVDKKTKSHDWWMKHYASWRDEAFKVFDIFLKKDKSFVDIGSWIGTTCLYSSMLSNHVYCIEADPLSISDLKCNIQANKFTNITLCEKPIFSSNTDMFFGSQDNTSRLKSERTSPTDIPP